MEVMIVRKRMTLTECLQGANTILGEASYAVLLWFILYDRSRLDKSSKIENKLEVTGE